MHVHETRVLASLSRFHKAPPSARLRSMDDNSDDRIDVNDGSNILPATPSAGWRDMPCGLSEPIHCQKSAAHRCRTGQPATACWVGGTPTRTPSGDDPFGGSLPTVCRHATPVATGPHVCVAALQCQ